MDGRTQHLARALVLVLLVFVLLISFLEVDEASAAQQVGPQHENKEATQFQKQQQQQQLRLTRSAETNATTTTTTAQKSRGEIEMAILDQILGQNYDKRIRPFNASAQGFDGPTIVRVNTLLRSVKRIDDKNMDFEVQLTLRQEWTDPRLAYGSLMSGEFKDYAGNISSIMFNDHERLWRPDLFFRNEKGLGYIHSTLQPNVLVRINSFGQVLYSVRMSLLLACPMDFTYFPMDKQNCTIEMASYGYPDDALRFVWKEAYPLQVAKYINSASYTLETVDTAYCTSRTATAAYSCLRADFIFKRLLSVYVSNIYIPCGIYVIASWITFWLDPSAIKMRLSLGAIMFLMFVNKSSAIEASLPPVSYSTAIGDWIGVCGLFLLGALLEYALVFKLSRLSERHSSQGAPPPGKKQAYDGTAGGQYVAVPVVSSDTTPSTTEIHKSAMRIDVASRVLFPLAFLLYNTYYWAT